MKLALLMQRIKTWIHPRLSALSLAFLVALSSFGLGWVLIQQVQLSLMKDEREAVLARLDVIGTDLASSIHERQSLLTGLLAFVKTHWDTPSLKKEFTYYAADLYDNDPAIRAIQIFPPQGPGLVYPLEGNEAVVGNSLQDLINSVEPEQQADLERAILTRELVLSAPYELKQGGIGLVVRQAIYRDGEFWGFVAVVMNLPPLLEIPGLNPTDGGLVVGLKDANGRVFFGDAGIDDYAPVVFRVPLPDRPWDLAAAPKAGWLVDSQATLRNYRMLSLVIALLAGSLAYFIARRQSNLSSLVKIRTAELKASAQNYRMLFEQAADAIVLADSNGNILDVNENYAHMLGYQRAELLHRNLRDLVAADEMQNFSQRLVSLNLHMKDAPYERSMVRKDGSRLVVEIKSHQLPDGRLQALLRDITERKQADETLKAAQAEAERLLGLADQSRRALLSMVEDQKLAAGALRESEERYRSLVDLSPDAIMLIRDQVVVFINPAGLRLLGASEPGQVLGTLLLEFFDPQNNQDIYKRFRKIATLRSTATIHEESVLRLDGSPLAVEVSAALVPTGLARPDKEGRQSIQIVLHDISERKLAEAELLRAHAELEQRVIERTRELQEANLALEKAARMKDEFLASMSHELRTPLTGILGLSEALQMVTYGDLTDRQRHALRNIEASGRHLLALINDILDLSKIEAGKLDLQIETALVGDICQASLQITRGMAQQKHQSVKFRMYPAGIVARLDARRVKQMVVNLLGNAIKFTPDGGNLGMDVRTDVQNGELLITVWDEGIGIEPVDLPRLFKPFTQLDSSLSRQYGGTGLGLSLVHSLAVLHGGHVEVESEPGKGSRFTLVLPWLDAAAEEEPEQPVRYSLTAVGSGVSDEEPLVLMADDNVVLLELMTDFLRLRHYRVSSAVSGTEFIELLEKMKADVVLMDIQMPGMDGIEVIQYIRAHADKHIAGLPVVAVTALAMAGDRERCLEAGANAYLSKPVELKHLLVVIEGLLASSDLAGKDRGLV
jgi:PAS domain S-box-containing protein